jgi:hypothetical protein
MALFAILAIEINLGFNSSPTKKNKKQKNIYIWNQSGSWHSKALSRASATRLVPVPLKSMQRRAAKGLMAKKRGCKAVAASEKGPSTANGGASVCARDVQILVTLCY